MTKYLLWKCEHFLLDYFTVLDICNMVQLVEPQFWPVPELAGHGPVRSEFLPGGTHWH